MRRDITQEEIDSLPEATRCCGIILDDPELDEWFSRLAGDGQEEEEEWPPQGDDECSDFSYDSEGYLKVAGDGACPDGQGDVRLRGSGAGVFLRERKQTQLSYSKQRTSPGSTARRSQSCSALGALGLE